MDDAGLEHAAILLMAVGEEEAAEVFKYLSPKEVQKLGETSPVHWEPELQFRFQGTSVPPQPPEVFVQRAAVPKLTFTGRLLNTLSDREP